MTTRFWIATLGNWLGLPLSLAAVAVALVSDNPGFRVLACLLSFWVGWGTHRFQKIMDDGIPFNHRR